MSQKLDQLTVRGEQGQGESAGDLLERREAGTPEDFGVDMTGADEGQLRETCKAHENQAIARIPRGILRFSPA
ncbi:hypothetical protein [Arthrobacter sp. MYb222]|uniref:hypothetical protein n=1 Tax=Arthrobacter sp. MYb222 TaxID=1848599 RepID=UPI0015E46FF4|nr:hypothetical protein [Arthrobacter sp. MYb222]